jgi:hypothetical protein
MTCILHVVVLLILPGLLLTAGPKFQFCISVFKVNGFENAVEWVLIIDKPRGFMTQRFGTPPEDALAGTFERFFQANQSFRP